MPNPNPTSNRALVHYRLTDPQPPKEGVAPMSVGTQQTELFELDPPTNNIAEVEKRWLEANGRDSGKEWVDAHFPDTPAEVPPVEAPPPPPVDAQITRERAAGREKLPPTVTEDEEAAPKGTIKPVKGAGDDDEDTFAGHPLSFYDQYADEEALTAVDGVGEATAHKIVLARRKRDRESEKK